MNVLPTASTPFATHRTTLLRTSKIHTERGAINIVFTVFIAAALAFLLVTLAPMMRDTTTEESSLQALYGFAASDVKVTELAANGIVKLAPNAAERLAAALDSIERQVPSPSGTFCAAVYNATPTGVGVAVGPIDSMRRPCSLPSSPVLTGVQNQVASVGGEKAKQYGYFSVFYERNGVKFLTQPAVTDKSAPVGVAMAPASSNPYIIINPDEPTPTATPTNPQAPNNAVNRPNVMRSGNSGEGGPTPAVNEGSQFQF